MDGSAGGDAEVHCLLSQQAEEQMRRRRSMRGERERDLGQERLSPRWYLDGLEQNEKAHPNKAHHGDDSAQSNTREIQTKTEGKEQQET
jgi:hypothetical protein